MEQEGCRDKGVPPESLVQEIALIHKKRAIEQNELRYTFQPKFEREHSMIVEKPHTSQGTCYKDNRGDNSKRIITIVAQFWNEHIGKKN